MPNRSPSDRRRSLRRQNSWNPVLKHAVDGQMMIWCPECTWHQSDSNTSRNRLGHHIVNEHYDIVAFQRGVEPDDLCE